MPLIQQMVVDLFLLFNYFLKQKPQNQKFYHQNINEVPKVKVLSLLNHIHHIRGSELLIGYCVTLLFQLEVFSITYMGRVKYNNT